MLHQQTTTEVGSSAEQLTSPVNEHLLTSLDNLHKALQIALDKHAILSLYNWLYDATLSFIKSAACAIDEDQHVLNYITVVIEDLGGKLSQPQYKHITSRKRNLLDQLVELYKAIMQVCVRAGRNSILTQDDISTTAIVSISNQIELLLSRIESSKEDIAEQQERIKTALTQFTPARALENHPGLSDYRLALTRQLTSLTDTFHSTQFEVQDEKEKPAELIDKIQAEIARVRALSLDVADSETDLLANSQAKNRIDHQFEYLRQSERTHANLLTVNIDVEAKKAETITADLARQKQMIETLSERKSHHTDDLGKNLDTFANTAKAQGHSGPWHSEENDGVQGALASLRLTLRFVESMSFSVRDELVLRKRELQSQIHTINGKVQDLKESQNDAKESQAETKRLDAEYVAKQKQVAHAMPAIFAKQKQTEKRLAEALLNKAKSVYFLQLEMRKKHYREKINENEHYKFKLPSPKPFAYFTGLSGIGILGTTTLAVAGFAFKVAALAFIVSNPAGWITGLAVGTAALLASASVFGTKSYNRYKKNKLLNQFETYEKEALFKQNQTLKEQKIETTTRHLMMRHGIKIKPDAVASTQGDAACYIVGKESEQVQLFLNVARKELFFKSGHRAITVAKEATEFRAQVKCYSAAGVL